MTRTMLLVLAALAALLCGCDKKATTVTKEGFAEQACAKMKVCDEERYQEMGGDNGCVAFFEATYLSEEECDFYHADRAARCIDEATALACGSFLSLLEGTLELESCNHMCDAPDDADTAQADEDTPPPADADATPTDGDTEQPDGDAIATEVSEQEFAQAICARVKECDPVLYEEMGGDILCVPNFEGEMLSELACDHYHADRAAQCLVEAAALSCDDFIALLSDINPLTPNCNTMCDAVTDDDEMTDDASQPDEDTPAEDADEPGEDQDAPGEDADLPVDADTEDADTVTDGDLLTDDDAIYMAKFTAAQLDRVEFPVMTGILAGRADWTIIERVMIATDSVGPYGWHFFRGYAWQDKEGDVALEIIPESAEGANDGTVFGWVRIGGAWQYLLNNALPVKRGVWYTLAIVFEVTAHELLLYWDDQVAAQVLVLAAPVDDSANDNPLLFGGQKNGDSIYSESDATLLHHAWLGRLLSADEIAAYDGTLASIADPQALFDTAITSSAIVDTVSKVTGANGPGGAAPEFLPLP